MTQDSMSGLQTIGLSRIFILSILGTGCLICSPPLNAQIKTHATVPISARVPSSVSLNVSVLPVTIVIKNGIQQSSEVPIRIQWNLNPREAQGFRVLATLAGDGCGLTSDDRKVRIPGTKLEGRVGDSGFRRFGERLPAIVLLDVSVTEVNRKSQQETKLELKINDDLLHNLPDGIYHGWIQLDTRII